MSIPRRRLGIGSVARPAVHSGVWLPTGILGFFFSTSPWAYTQNPWPLCSVPVLFTFLFLLLFLLYLVSTDAKPYIPLILRNEVIRPRPVACCFLPIPHVERLSPALNLNLLSPSSVLFVFQGHMPWALGTCTFVFGCSFAQFSQVSD